MIGTFRSARGRRDEGASAIEFAFIGTLIVLPLVFGAISFGMVFTGNLATSNSARQAARVGTVVGDDTVTPNTCADIAAEVDSSLPQIGLTSSDVNLQVLVTEPATAETTICRMSSGGVYSTGSPSTVPCSGLAVDSQVTVYVRSMTTMFFIPPYYFKADGYPVEGKGVYRCEFS